MIDKKISNQIDLLIKKLKDNELGSIKVTNKTNSIEITNAVSSSLQNIQQEPSKSLIHNSQPEESLNILSIDSPMVGIVYMTPKPSSPPFVKSGQKVKKGDIIKSKHLISKRPGSGISPSNIEKIIGKKITLHTRINSKIEKDSPLWTDFQKNQRNIFSII